jgi:hypothetical protein
METRTFNFTFYDARAHAGAPTPEIIIKVCSGSGDSEVVITVECGDERELADGVNRLKGELDQIRAEAKRKFKQSARSPRPSRT